MDLRLHRTTLPASPVCLTCVLGRVVRHPRGQRLPRRRCHRGGIFLADALDVARENVALYGLDDVVSHQGDLLQLLGRARFDLIISNPPYVTAESMAMLPQEFLPRA